MLRQIRHLSDHYHTLELPRNSSIKEIKLQFKRLSKKYHPDLHPNSSPEEKASNKERFMEIVAAYDVLKHKEKKRQYDAQLQPNRSAQRSFSEARYYSKSGTYAASGLNTTRNRVRYNGTNTDNSTFSGRHINYGDRYDVPHFNYSEHLHKHLKFEQRILGKHIADADRDKIIAQLRRSGLPVSEELITKHLMRQVDSSTGMNSQRESTYRVSPREHMYQGPTDDSNVLRGFAILGGAVTGVYWICKMF